MKTLSDEHRKALDEALTSRPVGHVPRTGYRGGFVPSAAHRAMADHLGLSLALPEYQVLVCSLAEHIDALQRRLDAVEAKRK